MTLATSGNLCAPDLSDRAAQVASVIFIWTAHWHKASPSTTFCRGASSSMKTIWNLTPVEPATNSAKNDVLPDLDLYLPRLANLHFEAIEVAKSRPKLLEDYTQCFRLDAAALMSIGESGLESKFREVILPQAQIAINQGFQSGWRMHTPVVAVSTKRRFVTKEAPDGRVRFLTLKGPPPKGLSSNCFQRKPSQSHCPITFPFILWQSPPGVSWRATLPSPKAGLTPRNTVFQNTSARVCL